MQRVVSKYHGAAGPEGLARMRYAVVSAFAKEKIVEHDLMIQFTQGGPFCFQAACVEWFDATVNPKFMEVYTKGVRENLRGYFVIERGEPQNTVKTLPGSILPSENALVHAAFANNVVAYASGRYLYSKDIKDPSAPIRRETMSIAVKNDEIAIPILPGAGLIRLVGPDLTFGNASSPHEAVVDAAVGFSRLSNLYQQATRDHLTGLYNKGEMEAILRSLAGDFLLDGSDTAIVMVDLDHFKGINDKHGHLKGDEALVLVADICVETLRATDAVSRVARAGGEELVFILPDLRDLGGAVRACGRAKQKIQELRLLDNENRLIPITASLGVTSFSSVLKAWRAGLITSDIVKSGLSPETLMHLTLKLADDATYASKDAGRNRVSCSDVVDGDGGAKWETTTIE